MFRWVVLAVAVVVLCSDAEGRRRDPGNRRRGPKVDSRELGEYEKSVDILVHIVFKDTEI